MRIGDKLMLGPGGPVLIVEGLGTGPVVAVPRGVKAGLGQQTVLGLIGNALAKAKEERRQGRRGSTAFLKAVAEEVGKDSRRKIRWLTTTIVVLVLLLGAGVYGVYRLLSAEVAENRQTTRGVEDSARAETERLRENSLWSPCTTASGRCLGSVLIAKPNRISCRIGTPTIIAKVRRSRWIWFDHSAWAPGQCHAAPAQRGTEVPCKPPGFQVAPTCGL